MSVFVAQFGYGWVLPRRYLLNVRAL